ncbi:MAG: peptidase S41 [Flavobacteriaceae bacterium]|nr:peptidase S41 [Flavobacteriaceae bacterium]
MMYKHLKLVTSFFLSLSLLVFTFQGCKKDPIDSEDYSLSSNGDSDDNFISLEGDLQISDFVWKGLNEFYYWQEEVNALSDTLLQDSKAYAKYINNNLVPETFFESLKHPDDRFSWIQDDYLELENSLQGIVASNGVEFGLLLACENCNQVIGFVKYILEGSNASEKNIRRGDFFNGVNGTSLTVNNYRDLLFSDNLTYSLNMVSIKNGIISNNGVVVELTKEENFETNPIQVSKIVSTDVGNVGYLMYNQFVASKSNDLNKMFAEFKTNGIIDLVIDLRYNGGGSVRNCVELASMITGQLTGEVFSNELWNSKLDAYFLEKYGSDSQKNRFVNVLSDGEPINSLELNRVFILTTSESASASELLINGLAPLIEVIHIGEQTVGKNVGSITVYDYIDNDGTRNPDHRYAMQPIVLKIANSEGFADYADGLEPSTLIEEDLQNMGTLGDKNEPFLATVLNLIEGTTDKYNIPKALLSRKFLIEDPQLLKRRRMFSDKLIPLNFIQENN